MKIKRSIPAFLWVLFSLLSSPAPSLWAAPDQAVDYLYAIKKDGKYGFVNQEGKLSIEPRYESASGFFEGLACVRLGERAGFIDISGQVVIPLQYTFAAPYSEGLARVQTAPNAKMGYIDPIGKMVIPPAYEQADDFHEGLARVGAKKKYGFINQKGNVVIPLQYDTAQGFSQGLALVKIGADYFFIDAKGKKVLDPDCKSAGSFKDGLAYFSDGQAMGYLDQKGKIAIAPKFESARAFSEGLAAVEQNKLWGYIDKNGQWVIKPQFDSASDFKEGLAAVKAGGQYGYIDTAGQIVIRPQFKTCGSYNHGLAWCSASDETGYSYINQEGRYVWTETKVISGPKEINFESPQGEFNQTSPWKVDGGWLTFGGKTGGRVNPRDNSCYNVFPDRIYDSFSFSAEARWDSGSGVYGYGLVFLYMDQYNHYRFDVNGEGYFRISKQIGGVWSDIYPWKKCTLLEKKNLLKVVGWPGSIQCYINDVEVAAINEPDAKNLHGYTRVALFSETWVQCSFNNVKLQELSPEEKDRYRQTPFQRGWDFSRGEGVFKLNPNWTLAGETLNFIGGEKGLSYNNIPIDKYLADFTLSFDTTWTGGDSSYGYGAIFRYKDSKNYYEFKVSPKGYYRLVKRSNDVVTELVKWTKNDCITASANAVKIVCRNANIKCYVNNTLVVNLDEENRDGAAWGYGDYVSLGVTSSGPITCAFDNFTVVENTVIWRDTH